MDSAGECWAERDKRSVFLAMMEALAGGAHVSFEGDLGKLRLRELIGASGQETAALKRNTLWPEQDFIIVLLEPTTVRTVLSAIRGNVPRKILHIQIEKNGVLEFAAYDNFHPGCIVFG